MLEVSKNEIIYKGECIQTLSLERGECIYEGESGRVLREGYSSG